jgi:hypothetical protein
VSRTAGVRIPPVKMQMKGTSNTAVERMSNWRHPDRKAELSEAGAGVENL